MKLRGYSSDQKGSIMMFVLGALVIVTSATALSSRTLFTRKGAMKQSEALSARKIAEGGIAELTSKLNTSFTALWLQDFDADDRRDPNITDGWSNQAGKYRCGKPLPGATDIKAITTGTVDGNNDHYYELETYSFSGNRYFGGKGTITMRGRLLKDGSSTDEAILTSDNNVISTAVITQTVSIDGKPCDKSKGEEPEEAGLIISSGDLGNNNVLGGSAICLIKTAGCNDDTSVESQINALGDITGGAYAKTPRSIFYPTFISEDELPMSDNSTPTNLRWNSNPLEVDGCYQYGPKKKDCGDLEIITKDFTTRDGATSELDRQCIYFDETASNAEFFDAERPIEPFVDGELVCRFEKLNFSSGNDLIINTDSGVPVTIFLVGDCNTGNCTNDQTLSFKGQSKIDHTGTTVLKLYGNDTGQTSPNQFVTFSGNADADPDTGQVKMWFPDGEVGVNGGGQNKCNTTNYLPNAQGDLGCDPDIYGRVWALSWDASNANDAGIVVPSQFSDNSGDNDPNVYAREVSASSVTGWGSYKQ